MQRSNCRECGKPLIWLRSATTQTLLCLDAEPVEGGTVGIVDGAAVVKHGSLFEERIEPPFYQQHKCAEEKQS